MKQVERKQKKIAGETDTKLLSDKIKASSVPCVTANITTSLVDFMGDMALNLTAQFKCCQSKYSKCSSQEIFGFCCKCLSQDFKCLKTKMVVDPHAHMVLIV